MASVLATFFLVDLDNSSFQFCLVKILECLYRFMNKLYITTTANIPAKPKCIFIPTPILMFSFLIKRVTNTDTNKKIKIFLRKNTINDFFLNSFSDVSNCLRNVIMSLCKFVNFNVLRDISLDQPKKKEGNGHAIISPLKLRGDRIILPEFVNKMAKFSESKEYSIKASKGSVIIEEFDM